MPVAVVPVGSRPSVCWMSRLRSGNRYATGPAPIYYGSGYIPGRDFWVYGFILGMLYLLAYLLIGVPWLLHLHGA